jgi:glycogen operon protein
LLATLFLSRGVPMLQAGDELGRTQFGNNNAYAQDNSGFWLDWEKADEPLVAFVAELGRLRREHPLLSTETFLTGKGNPPDA